MKRIKSEPTQTIPTALAQFEYMPLSAYIRLPIVAALYGISFATVWRNSKNGKMPKPVKLSERCTAWNVGLIKADLAARAAA